MLLVLGILWLGQTVGTYYQIRHYRKVLSRITREGGEGYVGVGNAKARFGKGVILILVALYTIINLIGEERVQGAARFAASNVLTRYTLLPFLAVFFLPNPMAYTFGTFLEEKYKPAFYDSAVSFVHPTLGLFPHINPAELFVYLGVAEGIRQLGLPESQVAVRLLLAGLVVIFIRGIVTQWITFFLARRQGVEL